MELFRLWKEKKEEAGLNFVFGEASLDGKVALIALPRLSQKFYRLLENNELYYEKAVKEAVHELGHTHIPKIEDREGVLILNPGHLKKFDFLVLEPYLSIPVRKLPALDIMEEITRVTGHRVSLDNVAQATLGVRKSGSGLEAVRLFREGRIEELKRYCLDDVRITKELYEYGQKHGEFSFASKRGWNQYSIPVSWITKNEKTISSILQEAFKNRERIEIEYISSTARSGEDFRKRRKVDIYSFGDFYFEAFCHLRNELRTFRVDRVLNVKMTNQSYTIPNDYVPGIS